MKPCIRCWAVLPLTDFYVHSMMGDGRLGKCKECCKADAKARYRDPEARARIALYDRERFQRPERRRKAYIYAKNQRVIHPDRYKARYAVRNAIRDKRLVRQPCEVCGGKSEAHHPDYSKPLDVRWLCKTHHEALHHAN